MAHRCANTRLSSEDGYNGDASAKEQTPALSGLEALRLDLLPAASVAFHLVPPVLVLGSTLASPLVVMASAGMASSSSSPSSSSSFFINPKDSLHNICKLAGGCFHDSTFKGPNGIQAHVRAVLSMWVTISNWFKD